MEETQVFVPLGGKDGLFFVGPPSETPDSFDPDKVALFHFPGDHAIRMHVGTWHVAPFAVTEATDYINIQGDQVSHYTDGYDFQGARQPGFQVRPELEGRNNTAVAWHWAVIPACAGIHPSQSARPERHFKASPG